MTCRRQVLPNRRLSRNVVFRHGRHEYTATIGYYLEGEVCRVGEVFLNTGKAGTELDVATRDSAVALSFALQYGCPPEVMRAAFLRDPDGKPAGVLGALLDAICDGDDQTLSGPGEVPIE